MAAVRIDLTDAEHEQLERVAVREGVSVDEVARRAVREHLGLAGHDERVAASAARIAAAHADALDRLGR